MLTNVKSIPILSIAKNVRKHVVLVQRNVERWNCNLLKTLTQEALVKLGWIKDGMVYNAKGEKVASIEKQELVDSNRS